MEKCPCCEKPLKNLQLFDICDNCGWEYDPVQNIKADFRGGANIISLNDMKKIWSLRNEFSAKQVLKFSSYQRENCELKTIILGLTDCSDFNISKSSYDENFLYKMLLLGVRYFKVFPFKRRTDNNEIFVRIGKNNVQSIKSIMSNIRSFAELYNEKAILDIDFDSSPLNLYFTKLNYKERYSLVENLVNSGCFERENKIECFFENFSSSKFVLCVRKKCFKVLQNDLVLDQVCDLSNVEIECELKEDIYEQLEYIDKHKNQKCVYNLRYKINSKKMRNDIRLLFVKKLIAMNQLLPKLTIVNFDEYYDDSIAIYTTIKSCKSEDGSVFGEVD